MSDLPPGWEMVTVGEAGEVSLGRQRAPRYHRGDGMRPYLRVANVFEDRIDTTDVMEMHFSDEEFERYRLRPGDVLLNEGQSPHLLGRPAIYRGNPADVAFTNSLIRFRARPEVMPEWALIVFRHHMHSKRFMRESRITTNIAHLSASRFSAVEFPIPPLAEQKRIVAAIEEQLSRVDAGAAALERARLSLKRMRTAVLAWACMGRLTVGWRSSARDCEPIEVTIARVRFEQSSTGRRATDDVIRGRAILSVGKPETSAPDGWRWTPLSAVARLESGHTPSRRHPEYWDGPFPWIGIQDAREHHGCRIAQTRQHVSDLGLRHSSARLLPIGTVCLSRTASVGYVTIMGVSMATSQDFVNWVCSEALLPEFLLLALMAEGDGIRRFGRGTTHTTIYYPEIKALYICIPPVEEQREIVEQVERSRSTIALLEDALAEAAHRTDALRFSILASAFTGKLVPQDPADESVFALPGISIDPFSSNDRRTNTTQARRIRAI